MEMAPSVVVLGCARDVAVHLDACLSTLEGVAGATAARCGPGARIGWLFFENDSKDETRASLEAFCARAPALRGVVVESGLDAWLPRRTHRLAHGRNMLLRRLELCGWLEGAALVVVADLDEVNADVDLVGVTAAADLVLGGHLDVATANQPSRYYDLWALRTAAAPGNSWSSGGRYDGGNFALGLRYFFPDRPAGAEAIAADEAPVPVLSAFGGLGIYAASKIRDRTLPSKVAPGVFYDGRDEGMARGTCFPWLEAQDCEHVAFHASLRRYHAGLAVAIVPRLLNCRQKAGGVGALGAKERALGASLMASMLKGGSRGPGG